MESVCAFECTHTALAVLELPRCYSADLAEEIRGNPKKSKENIRKPRNT